MTGFIMKCWKVTISGYGTGLYNAGSRGKALADAWRCDAFAQLPFGEFLKIARCCREYPETPFGDPITVDGKPAFYLGADNASVHFCYPDSHVTSYAHPFEVLPEHYRPATYRAA